MRGREKGGRRKERGGGEKGREASDVQIYYMYRLGGFWECGDGLGGNVFLDVMTFLALRQSVIPHGA